MAVTPYKEKEFKAFIAALDKGQVAHWVEIARALNVSDETILIWKDLPEAQEAIQRGIDHALKKMEEAGSKDWKMWESKLKMLGVNPAQAIDLKTNNPIGLIVGKYGEKGGVDDLPKSEKAES